MAGNMTTFNINDGYCEAIVRGHFLGLLRVADYTSMAQCERLEDLKLQLTSTSYGAQFMQDVPAPLHSTTIADYCTKNMVREFNYLRANAVYPLAKFLDYITYGYMIDNMVLLITGTLRESDLDDLKEKCHPLGMFSAMESIVIGQSVSELYNEVLVDTPLAPYLQECLSVEDLDEMNIEIIRNTLYKSYLEDFYKYCTDHLGGTTAEVMSTLLKFESDRRTINITLNSIGTELTSDDRLKLYPRIGLLYPECIEPLSLADTEDGIKQAVQFYDEYRVLFEQTEFDEDKALEDVFFEREVQLNIESFERQFSYAAFYSYFKLKEQEVRNILWISECILQQQPEEINRYIPLR
jgi:V-type H+-transporting ATPase subunit d